MDLGAGEGRVMVSAVKCGAYSAVGYELPANLAHRYVFDAVIRRSFAGIFQVNNVSPFVRWLAKDIDQVLFRRLSSYHLS